MQVNPYQPSSIDSADTEVGPERDRALASLRLAFLILLAPALMNYYAFDTYVVSAGGLPRSVEMLSRAVNLSGFVIGGVLIWQYGLSFLERISHGIRAVFAGHCRIATWDGVLYQSLESSTVLAIAGAALWFVWVVGFYFVQIDFQTISWWVGVPAHLLAAMLYVPLLYRWYSLAKRSPKHDPQRQEHSDPV
ncbi:hypothetical protein FYK55_04855 [Roseiconus nitratireducens]|uniref:Uncharacterized protein n=1 Tax=Roseiconus nitratireducens TaxID=2605748 RepID=A0A5M6DIZ8_9BACT|nr:hypothetical protein [Roseiconus nitratireducens]KAA5546222.1 hypothetical protein FYK55_04855 [Roseiconus nitratireducens]